MKLYLATSISLAAVGSGLNASEHTSAKILMDRMQSLVDTPLNAYRTGPNCWNSIGLVYQQSLPKYQGSFEHFRDQFCQKLDSSQSPTFGDIGSIEAIYKDGSKGKEVHAFVFVSEEKSFTKNGPERTMPYHWSSVKDIEIFYDVPENCRQVQDHQLDQCNRYLNYYRCDFPSRYALKKGSDDDRLYALMIKVNEMWSKVDVSDIKNGQVTKGLTKQDAESLLTTYFETSQYFLSKSLDQMNVYQISELFDYMKSIKKLLSSFKTDRFDSDEKIMLDDPHFLNCKDDVDKHVTHFYYRLTTPDWPFPLNVDSCRVEDFTHG